MLKVFPNGDRVLWAAVSASVSLMSQGVKQGAESLCVPRPQTTTFLLMRERDSQVILGDQLQLPPGEPINPLALVSRRILGYAFIPELTWFFGSCLDPFRVQFITSANMPGVMSKPR